MRTIVIIGTSAYVNPIKVSAVKNLLGSGVLRFELAGNVIMLCGDDRITTARRALESFAIDKANAAANELDQCAVLKLIRGLRNGGATSAEQVCEQILGDAQLSCVHTIVDHQQQPREPRLRCVIT